MAEMPDFGASADFGAFVHDRGRMGVVVGGIVRGRRCEVEQFGGISAAIGVSAGGNRLAIAIQAALSGLEDLENPQAFVPVSTRFAATRTALKEMGAFIP
jgi:hypothetical protein